MIDKIINYLYSRIWINRYRNFRKKYEIDNSFIFNGSDIKLYGDGRIIIGYGSHIGSYSTIQSIEGCVVKIGRNCRISHNVRVYSKSDYANQDFSNPNLRKKIGDVLIGDNVWIGVNTYIGPKITIGKNSVVAANSVVTKDVPENCIVGAAIGASIEGDKVIINFQRVEFALLALEQIINNAAKTSYITSAKHNVPIVIRLVIGKGWGQGPVHSQSLEGLFTSFVAPKLFNHNSND